MAELTLDYSINSLQNLINNAYSTFHAVEFVKQKLLKAGFKELYFEDFKDIKTNSKYFLIKNNSAIIAFTIGGNPKDGLKIIGSHTDSPGLKIKHNADMQNEAALMLNTEVYGGPILHTWFDRTLSVAGRVSVIDSKDNKLKFLTVNLNKFNFIIPSLAIHMNNKVNTELSIQKQKTLLPILSLNDTDNNLKLDELLKENIRQNYNIETEKILSTDIYLYDKQKVELCGNKNELINAPKLDNLAMLDASLNALLFDCDNHKGINILFSSDNEEVGSRSQQGANSLLLRQIIELIYENLYYSKADTIQALNDGLMISADLAHAIHPHYPEISDPTNRPKINKGPVIKIAANQSYASDCKSIARFIKLCQDCSIPYQTYHNNSDKPGGSTIGPISTAFLTIPTVDVGNAIWAMHSIRETAGCLDQFYMTKVMSEFFKIVINEHF